MTLIKEQRFNRLFDEYELLATEIDWMNICYKIHIAVMFVFFINKNHMTFPYDVSL